jgi:hypothetical protein
MTAEEEEAAQLAELLDEPIEYRSTLAEDDQNGMDAGQDDGGGDDVDDATDLLNCHGDRDKENDPPADA